MNPVDELVVNGVKKYQESNGYSDKKMADELQCSRTMYNQVKTGKKRAGLKFYRGAMKFMLPDINNGHSSFNVPDNNNGKRKCSISRETKETNVNVNLDIDCIGECEINTGYGIFEHLLSQLGRHGKFDIKIQANGDDPHHIAEDVGICLGQALNKALGEKRGIVRMAEATVPMDDALATAIVDISGRGYTVLELPFTGNDMSGFPADLIRHFLESFAIEGKFNLHAKVLYGSNDHHKAEALFKALGRALYAATRIDKDIAGELPSTKEFLER